MNGKESRRPRKRLFGAGVISVTFMAMSIFQINIPAGIAHPGAGLKGAIFDIVPATATVGTAAASAPGVPQNAPQGGTFLLTGNIYRFRTVSQADCTLPSISEDDDRFLGTWRAWGEVGDTGKLVMHHTLSLTKLNSTIEVQGTTGQIAENGGVASALQGSLGPPTTGPSEILAVVGGTNRFSGLSGQANIRPYCNQNLTGSSPFRYDRAFCLGVE